MYKVKVFGRYGERERYFYTLNVAQKFSDEVPDTGDVEAVPDDDMIAFYRLEYQRENDIFWDDYDELDELEKVIIL